MCFRPFSGVGIYCFDPSDVTPQLVGAATEDTIESGWTFDPRWVHDSGEFEAPHTVMRFGTWDVLPDGSIATVVERRYQTEPGLGNGLNLTTVYYLFRVSTTGEVLSLMHSPVPVAPRR